MFARVMDRTPQVRSPVQLGALLIAAAAAVVLWLAVEFLWLPRVSGLPASVVMAAERMEDAHRVLWSTKAERNLLPPEGADPNRTGMIGPEFTVLTTSLGSLPAKRTTTVPDFAAALALQIRKLGLDPGTPVVVVVSGSLVGGDVAALAAVEALDLRPVLVSSVSASMWGATDPEFTWLDIESTLRQAGVIEAKTLAAVIGGTGGTGREMNSAGISAIRAAAERTGVGLVEAESLSGVIDSLLQEIGRALEGTEPGLVINVGGAVVGLGTCRESYEMVPGLSRRPPDCTSGIPGIAFRLAEEGVPILHVLNIRRLAIEWGLPFDPQPLPAAETAIRWPA